MSYRDSEVPSADEAGPYTRFRAMEAQIKQRTELKNELKSKKRDEIENFRREFKKLILKLEPYTNPDTTPNTSSLFYTPKYFKEIYNELLDAAEAETDNHDKIRNVIENHRNILETYGIIGGGGRRTKKRKTSKRKETPKRKEKRKRTVKNVHYYL